MDEKFKVGDRVRVRIRMGHGDLVEGRAYTVSGYVKDQINKIMLEGTGGIWYEHRFDLVELAGIAKPQRKEKKPRAIMAGDLVFLRSNNRNKNIEFYPAPAYDAYVNTEKPLLVKSVLPGGLFIRVVLDIPDNEADCYVDSNQCELALRKDGKPRIARKKTGGNKPKTKLDLRKKMNEKTREDGSGTCTFGFVIEGALDIHLRTYCHAALGYYKGASDVTEYALCTKGHTVGLGVDAKERYKRFVEYIVRRSSYSHAFIQEPRVKDIVDRGVLVRLNQCNSHIAAASVAVREGSEFPSKTNMWCELVDAGINENVAWLISRVVSSTNGKYGLNSSNGHSVIEVKQGMSAFITLLKQNHMYPTTQPNKFNSNLPYEIMFCGSGIKKTIGAVRGKSLFDVVMNACPTKVTGEGFNKVERILFEDVLSFAKQLTKKVYGNVDTMKPKKAAKAKDELS